MKLEGMECTVKTHGYPPIDGVYKVILAPNNREFLANVTGLFIQLEGQRWPIESTLILGDDDRWIKLQKPIDIYEF